MHLRLFNRGTNNTRSQTNSRCIATPVSGFLLRDRGSIVPTLYLCVSHTEALLMVSNTSYHKRLHGSHRFVYHILALFTACKRLAVFVHDFGCEGSILLYFI
jgi:hypothetical protein